MSIFERLELNIFQRLEEGLPLPDEMTLGEIARLWATTSDKSKNYDIDQAIRLRVKVMREAFKSGSLQGVDMATREEAEIAADETRGPLDLIPFADSNRLRIMRECNGHIIIRKSDFIAWLESEKTPMPVNCLLDRWGLDTFSSDVDALRVKEQVISKERKDKAEVQDIGKRYKEKYKDQPDVLNCRQAKKLPVLKQYYKDYPGNDPVKPDMWLELPAGPKGAEKKSLKEFIPTLD
ncbi:MAG: hypothetical protein Q8Q40_13635 [Methylococcaceae bacterium]|nr:hypothetical protein [Methylococcaceae bacterium]MDP3905000.1 hypothetical protein [Methylococcaceae bacterium]